MRLRLQAAFIATAACLNSACEGPCPPPQGTLDSMDDFIENRCHAELSGDEAWRANPEPRPSDAHFEAGEEATGVFARVFYSPSMNAWLEGERAGDVPEDAAAVLELYTDPDADAPVQHLSMRRVGRAWLFASHEPEGDEEVRTEGGVNVATCRGCHSFSAQHVFGLAAEEEPEAIRPAASQPPVIPGNPGFTAPPPAFQRGDQLSQRLAHGDPKVTAFLDFFSARTAEPLPLLDVDDVIHFPPQSLDKVQHQSGMAGCSTSRGGYPLSCGESFATAEVCQACHSSRKFGTRPEPDRLPQMSYFTDPSDPASSLIANWSMYGEYTASIMGLASRDPIWQAQIETETNYNDGVNARIIQDVCFSCHGPMGQRQLHLSPPGGMDQPFSLSAFFSVLNGQGYENPYPDSAQAAPAFAQYGALARDGISCELCHRVGPNSGPVGQWDGMDYEVFYGPRDPTVSLREEPHGPPYPFTARFQSRLGPLVTPDAVAGDGSAFPMKDRESVDVAHALNTQTMESYLREGVLCGGCHTLMVPKIPTGYEAGGTIPNSSTHPFYKRPPTCPQGATTFAADGNPLTDPCVGLSYEQTTYFEWLNSSFAPNRDNETCQSCHMPFVTNAENEVTTIIAQNEDQNDRWDGAPREYRRHRVLGINLFVHEMFQQFTDVLGIEPTDSNVPSNQQFVKHNLLNAEQSIVDQATSQANGTGVPTPQASAEITIVSLGSDGTHLSADLLVNNNTGHKFPSGAGFRRAMIKFEVLDAQGRVIWVSGQPNQFGVICDGRCNADGSNVLGSEFTTDPDDLQPHYATISRQDQAQIYEIREVDDLGILTSRTLSLFHHVKDNRILPRGWTPHDRCTAGARVLGLDLCNLAEITAPESEVPGSDLEQDPYYHDPTRTGADAISYRIPIADMAGTPASVRASMLYQTIPPGYLVARFNDGFKNGKYGDATRRAIYLTSHLNLDLGLKSTHPQSAFDIVNDDWTMTLHVARRALP